MTADAGDSSSDSGCRRLYRTGDAGDYQTADAGDSLSDSGRKRLYQTADAGDY